MAYCASRQELIPRGLTISTGAVPGWTRGSFHMAPTYLCRFPGSASIGCRGSPILPEGAMTEFQSEKNQLRLAALARRNALDGAMRDEAARNMLRASAQLDFPRGTLIAGFWPIRSEPDVRPLMADL